MFYKKTDNRTDPDLLLKLHQFTLETSLNFPGEEALLEELEVKQQELRFPAVDREVGSFLSFLTLLQKPRLVFEFGSGYGHSAFWYFQNNLFKPHEVVLTELRSDLKDHFENLSWPKAWRENCSYFNKDAFEVLENYSGIDFCLIDGQKGSYLNFLNALTPKLNSGALVIIDNAFWQGKFLDLKNNSASDQGIRQMHEELDQKSFQSCFLPISDGIILLYKK